MPDTAVISVRRLILAHGGSDRFVAVGGASGRRYVFNRLEASEVLAEDADGLLAKTATVGGCCGHPTRHFKVLEEILVG